MNNLIGAARILAVPTFVYSFTTCNVYSRSGTVDAIVPGRKAT